MLRKYKGIKIRIRAMKHEAFLKEPEDLIMAGQCGLLKLEENKFGHSMNQR